MADQLAMFTDLGERGMYTRLVEAPSRPAAADRAYPILASHLTRGDGFVFWYLVKCGDHTGWVTLSAVAGAAPHATRLREILSWSYAADVEKRGVITLRVVRLPYGAGPPAPGEMGV